MKNYCECCGSKLPPAYRCDTCGRDIKDEDRFNSGLFRIDDTTLLHWMVRSDITPHTQWVCAECLVSIARHFLEYAERVRDEE